jgi:Zn-dependent membrane protease YugP
LILTSLTVFGVDTNCSAQYNVADIGADQECAQPRSVCYSYHPFVVEVVVVVGALLILWSLLFSLLLLFMETKLLTIPPESNFSAPAIESLKSKLPVRSLEI